MKRKLYVAYGSNMSIDQMKKRCPESLCLGIAKIEGYRLFFKEFATIKKSKKHGVPILLWSISPKDEEALDKYEGFPRMYYKADISIDFNGRTLTSMVYIMSDKRNVTPPSQWYYDVIHAAYLRFDIDLRHLNLALSHTWDLYDRKEVRYHQRYIFDKDN